jgi:hypothetical protein
MLRRATSYDLGATSHAATQVSLRRFTWLFALFALFNIVAINGIGALLSPGGINDTVLPHSRGVLIGMSGDDSWGPMAAAREYIQEGEAAPLYQEIFFGQGIKFQYPPSALFALEAMLAFGEDRVRISDDMTFPDAPPVNDIIGWILLALAALSSAAILELALHKRTGTGAYRFDLLALIRVLIVCALTLTFYPAVKAFTLGQIQLWINSLFAVVLLLFMTGYRSMSGVLTGVICLIKPHYGLLILWGLINREWRFAIALALTGMAGLAASVFFYGWVNHLDYLSVLSFMSERGESYHANQSINGLLNRIVGLGAPELYANVNFDASGFPPYTPWVYWMTLASSAFIIIAAFLRGDGATSRTVMFALIAVSLTIASPLAWEHHYGILLPVFALMAGTLVTYPRYIPVLTVSFLLVSNPYPILNTFADTTINIVQSYTLAGGLLLLLVMHSYISSRVLQSEIITNQK